MGDSTYRKLSSSGPLFSASQLERGLDDAVDEFSPGSMPEIGALIANKYSVERLLARGGMGAVYAARHAVTSKLVAVKWMLPTLGQIKGARERFIREACATARIAHPNIVDIYDVGSEKGSVFLVMEFLRGETLSQRMARCSLSEAQTVALLMPALRGVAAAHAHGVVHRDLKPDNIFLCCNEEGEELEPKVLDFGISKITTDEARDLALTHSGAVLGTPYYMSPEQVRGARNVDARADVYAFGVMLFEGLTGQRPFEAETYNELILKIATEPAPSAFELNPGLQPEMVEVIERAMARDPALRFQTIEELALALEPFGGGVRFRNGRAPDPALISGDFPVPRIPAFDSKLGPLRTAARSTTRTPTRTPARATHSTADGAPPRRRGALLTFGVLAATLLLCAGVGALLMRGHKPEEHVSIAHPAPQPTAAEVSPATPATGPETLETSVSAVQQGVSAPASDEASAQHAAGATPKSPKTQHSAPLPNSKRWISEPPAPEPITAPTPSKRTLPKDWDDRLSIDTPHVGEAPAGHIDAHDFR
jgi:serine/threonine protein kinase